MAASFKEKQSMSVCLTWLYTKSLNIIFCLGNLTYMDVLDLFCHLVNVGSHSPNVHKMGVCVNNAVRIAAVSAHTFRVMRQVLPGVNVTAICW